MLDAGRGCWKIENEGFNNQKNGIYEIKHLNSRNTTAMKICCIVSQRIKYSIWRSKEK